MCKKTLMISACLGLVLNTSAAVKITIDHNTGNNATAEFKFKHVPSPAKDDAARNAKLKVIVGQVDSSSGGLNALIDGNLPEDEDQPHANFFFSAGSDGGRFLMDFGSAIDISQVNTYSWHADTRGPQVYNLFASDGAAPNFNPGPDARTDPAICGWKLIATVDTRPGQGDTGGQYGVSVTDSSGSLGKFRYLLFDSIPAEDDDPWGNTFFSEIDVIAAQH